MITCSICAVAWEGLQKRGASKASRMSCKSLCAYLVGSPRCVRPPRGMDACQHHQCAAGMHGAACNAPDLSGLFCAASALLTCFVGMLCISLSQVVLLYWWGAARRGAAWRCRVHHITDVDSACGKVRMHAGAKCLRSTCEAVRVQRPRVTAVLGPLPPWTRI